MTGLEDFLASYGILAVVVGTFLEGETILLLAGIAVHSGYLDLPSVVAAGFFGSVAGDQLYFYLGRRHGAALLAKRPRWHARVARARRFLDRHHIAFILGFRFLYGLRTVSPFAIGLSGVSVRRYVILNAAGAFVWSCAVVLLGYSIGRGAEALLGRMKEVELGLLVAVAVVGAAFWVARSAPWRRRRQDAPPADPTADD
jgi:membrane protein DedA with SNARE-associated domain